ncbi:hypothetical protein [Sorangium sp. So ce131]|uniref:hypothetical protein n=1 Tax=Sorangium sp. So ce131 TaxID=3133282 RepID=UPI003F614A59
MQNFRDAVKQALRGQAVDMKTETQWDEVLREFVTGINESEPLIHAFVRRGAAPSVRHLVLAPKGRRDQAHIVLSLEATPRAVVVLSGDRREFTEVDDFQEFLIYFAGLADFRSTLKTLGKVATAPVTGFLRFGPVTDRSPSRDIVVEVPYHEQHNLADAAESAQRAEVKIYVDPKGPSPLGQGVYDPKYPPRWLVAGGYALEIEHHNAELGRIMVRGTPLEPLNEE